MHDPDTLKGIRADGTLTDELTKKYPLYARFQKHDMGKLYTDDGVTDYSRSYWAAWRYGV